RVGADRPTVIEVDQDLQSGLDDLVRLLAFDIGDEAHAARVVFVAGVIETLLLGQAHADLPRSIQARASTPRIGVRPTRDWKGAFTGKFSPCRPYSAYKRASFFCLASSSSVLSARPTSVQPVRIMAVASSARSVPSMRSIIG